MKKFFNTTKERISKISNRGKKEMLALSAIVAANAPLSVFAGANTQVKNVVGGILKVILDIFMYIGILLAAWSVGMLVLAFKNEDADSKSRAMMMLVVSVMLIGLKALIQTTGILSNTGVTI